MIIMEGEMSLYRLAQLSRAHRVKLTLIAALILATVLGTLTVHRSIQPASAHTTQAPLQVVNTPPDFLVQDSLVMNEYDGATDDLLTAGLGQDGLASATAPTFANPANPTAAELRRLAIYNNYRALVDTSPGSGYGTLYGPAVGTESTDGKVAGKEYLAYASGATGTLSVTMMVQIPNSFDPENPCIVTAPSSGSRGVYGAIGTAGEWGLKKGCAVAYTDKGGGTGVHDLDTDTVTLIDGLRADAATAGEDSNFTAAFDPDFATNNPHRLAFKHAHSELNPEAEWGRHVLQSIEFAFYVLNLAENFGQVEGEEVMQTITPENTIVIASSVSNGGGASLRAAEQDTTGLIAGVAVSEPNVNPVVNNDLVIQQGGTQWTVPDHSRALFDYVTLLNVYQPCANLAPGIQGTAPLNLISQELGENRCAGLRAAGLLEADTLDEQAAEAQAIINDYGMLEEQNLLAPGYSFAYVYEAVAVTYAYAYGQFRVNDVVCGYTFAGVDAQFEPAALTAEQLAALFATSNGIPPTGGVQMINNNSQGGPKETRNSISSSGEMDQNLDGALCLRRLATGVDEAGDPLTGDELAQHQHVMDGIDAIRASGDLQGKPAIIVHGRNDALLPPNFTSRAYFGLNKIVEGETSNLYYYEVLNAHHLDALNGLPGFNSRYIPLHYYFIQALDLMYDHLQNETPLPPNQVVTTTPRGTGEEGTPPAITTDNLPPIDPDAASVFHITFGEKGENTVFIPEFPMQLFFPLVAR